MKPAPTVLGCRHLRTAHLRRGIRFIASHIHSSHPPSHIHTSRMRISHIARCLPHTHLPHCRMPHTYTPPALQDAEKAIMTYDGVPLDGRPLKISILTNRAGAAPAAVERTVVVSDSLSLTLSKLRRLLRVPLWCASSEWVLCRVSACGGFGWGLWRGGWVGG